MAALDPAEAGDLRFGGAWTPAQRLKNDVLHALVHAAIAIAARLPRAALRLACRAVGAIAWIALGRQRRAAGARLAAGLGPTGATGARAAFRGAADLLADTIALLDPDEPAGRTLRLEPASALRLREALAEGRGVVFVSAHLGPWERMAALLYAEGFEVATVARESYDPRLTALYERLRAPRGVRSIYRGQPRAARAMLRVLDAGGALGFLVDLPSRGVPTVRCRLFGQDAEVPVGPAQVALARGVPLLVGTPAPDPSGQGSPIVRITRVPAEGVDAHVLTQRVADELTGRIAAMPFAWLGVFGSAPLGAPIPPGSAQFAASARSSIH